MASSIWKQPISLEVLTAFSQNTAITHLGIEFTEIGADYLRVSVVLA